MVWNFLENSEEFSSGLQQKYAYTICSTVLSSRLYEIWVTGSKKKSEQSKAN